MYSIEPAHCFVAVFIVLASLFLAQQFGIFSCYLHGSLTGIWVIKSLLQSQWRIWVNQRTTKKHVHHFWDVLDNSDTMLLISNNIHIDIKRCSNWMTYHLCIERCPIQIFKLFLLWWWGWHSGSLQFSSIWASCELYAQTQISKEFLRIVTRWSLQLSRFFNKLPLLKSVIRYQFIGLNNGHKAKRLDLNSCHEVVHRMVYVESRNVSYATYSHRNGMIINLTTWPTLETLKAVKLTLMPTVMIKNWSISLFSFYGFTCWLWSVNTMNVCTMNVSPVKHMEILIRLTGL